MSTESTPTVAGRVAVDVGHAITALFLALGILGALRTGLDETAHLIVFTTAPGTAVAWLALGLVGAGMVTNPRRARIYLAGTAALLVAWALAGLVLDGAGGDMFVRERTLVGLHLIVGLAAAATVLAPLARRR